MDKKKQKRQIMLLIIFIATFALIIVSIFNQYSETETIKYLDFLRLIEENKVEEIDLQGDEEVIIGIKKDGSRFETDNPKTDTFKEFLLNKDIKVVNKTPINKIAINVVGLLARFGVLALLIAVMYKTMAPALKEKDNLIKETPDINFQSIAGNIEAKDDMEFLVDFLKSPREYKAIGAKLPKGIILYGNPGTGKTLMARAVAGEAGVPFYSVTGSDFIEMYAGLGAKRVRDLFKEAKKNAPCIVFIDEIDAIGTHRGKDGSSSEDNQTINALLSELDGFEESDSVIVMAATNRVDDLDSALIRPGRFDRHVNIGLPDQRDRLDILKIYAKNKEMDDTVNLGDLANITIGFSGASLEALMNEAAIIAVTKGSKVIRKEDIDDSYFKIAMKGNKKKNREDIDKKERELAAYHEAGHALATKILTDNHLHKVTIIPSTSGAGGATFSVPRKMGLMTKREILSNIKVLYAGRAAEMILREDDGEITTGASQDIKQATRYINSYFSEFGMSEKFGLLEIKDEKLYMDEAMKLSSQLYKETFELLNDNKDKLKNIAIKLIEKETLSGSEVDKILEKV